MSELVKHSCIVTCGLGQWYPRGMDRARESFAEHGWHGGVLHFRDVYPPGSPPFETYGYAFKPYALFEAARLGYRYLLWLDASIWAVRPLEPVFEKIAEDGHLLFRNCNGASLGEWCRDDALFPLGLTREQSFDVPEVTTSLIGLDASLDGTKSFLHHWMGYAYDGITFPLFPRSNVNNECSKHMRVRGHRYDQTAGSLIAHRLRMKLSEMPKLYAYFEHKTEDSILVNQGM
jgi:hypothetical protein